MNAKPKSPPMYRMVSLMIALAVLFSLALSPASMPLGAQRSYIVLGLTSDQVSSLVLKAGGRVTDNLEIIRGVAASLTEAEAAQLRVQPGVTSVWENGTVETSSKYKDKKNGNKDIPATDYSNVVGADYVWQQGVTGDNVTVAIIDTGIDTSIPAYRGDGKLNDRTLAWVDFVDGKRKAFDPYGHGTHVAGIIANNQIGSDGEANGVAPDANLVVVRVLDEKGYGTYISVIRGIQWVVEHKDQYNIRIMNMSIVAPVRSPYWADPINLAVMKAWSAGILVVAAAGNNGPTPQTMAVPGNNPYVLTVGAFTDNFTPLNWNDDYIAPFSSAGPTKDAFVKPDVVAPGGHILSPMANGTFLGKLYKENRVDPYYFKMAGTSQASAVVSGIAALVISAHPELTPDQVKYRIMFSANPWVDPQTSDAGYSIWQQGMGRVSAPDAVFQDISGQANAGMDIQADLAGTVHYEGFTTYDATTGVYHLRGDYGSWTGGFGNWSGGFGNWSGGFGNWSGGFGNWSGGFGNWSGSFGNWSGGFGNWSGGFGNWSGGFGNWSGGFGNWSGSFGNWSGGLGNWSGGLGNWSGGLGNWSGGLGNWSGGMGNWSGGMGNWSGGLGNWSGGMGNWSGGLGNWSGCTVWTGSVPSDDWVAQP